MTEDGSAAEMATWPFIEIGTGDAEGSRAFFADVMGWKVMGEGDQRYFHTPNGPIGLHGGGDAMMVVYFPVADLDAALGRVRAGGGDMKGQINDEPGFGRFATCVDPAGIRFGLHQKH